MAIAFDASAKDTVTATSLTYAHTCSGSNRILFVGVSYNNVTDITSSVTYNGVGLTKITEVSDGSVGISQLWYLIAPATGANNIVITLSSSKFIKGYSCSYTGAKQSGVPDASDTEFVSNTTATTTLTTIADNCWSVLHASVGSSLSAGAGSTQRESVSNAGIFDSNGALTPAGSKSMTVTQSVSSAMRLVMASFAPFVATAPTVTTQAVSSIGVTTATGNGNVTSDGGDTITQRGVCWSTSANPTTSDSTATSGGTTGAYTASITGLSAGTLYHVRAYAINSTGTSYGSDVTFTTLTLSTITGVGSLTGVNTLTL